MYFSKKEPFLLNYVKEVIFKIHKKRGSVTGFIQDFFLGVNQSVNIM